MADKFNGWSNYETWAVNLWMESDERVYKYWRGVSKNAEGEEELADEIQAVISDTAPTLDGLYADLLGAALSKVDWYEIAEHWIEKNAKERMEEA